MMKLCYSVVLQMPPFGDVEDCKQFLVQRVQVL